jgi:hypothetical protein
MRMVTRAYDVREIAQMTLHALNGLRALRNSASARIRFSTLGLIAKPLCVCHIWTLQSHPAVRTPERLYPSKANSLPDNRQLQVRLLMRPDRVSCRSNCIVSKLFSLAMMRVVSPSRHP